MAAFLSKLYQGEMVIDDHNYLSLAPPQDVIIAGEVKSRGLIPRDYIKVPHGSMPFAAKFPSEFVLPRDRWAEIIQRKEAEKSRFSDLILTTYEVGDPLLSSDQNGTNYCWTHGVKTCLESLALRRGGKRVLLSAASVAAQIKNYRNDGGWGGEALEFIVETGIASRGLWPENYWQGSKYLTTECEANMKLHAVKEWWDLAPRSFAELMSCVLLDIPVAIGLNWWSHEICAMDGVVLGSNAFGIRIRNSWSDSYGVKGFAVLTESKATPDDACCPVVQLPSAA